MNKVLYSILCFAYLVSYACVEHTATDPRKFHCETLDNGLSILLIEDPNATKSAAAMYVGVGSQDNPEQYKGLAHFLEHMLFIGTEEYPEVDALSHFVSNNGGAYNAFTSEDHTQYFFSVIPSAFPQAFDIFSSFFISPLFSEEYVDREKHAVDSEYKMGLKSDGRKGYEVFKTMANPNYPANKFAVGSLETFKEEEEGDLRQALVDFYEKHYSADRMYFVAVTPSHVDEYIEVIKTRLSAVPLRDTFKKPLPHRIRPQDLGKVIHVKTLSESEDISMVFQIPNQQDLWYSPATSFIASLIGDEGEGSILSVLKQEGLANGLSASSSKISDKDSLFSINVSLTEKGRENVDSIVALINQYIYLIKNEGVEKWRFNELQRVSYMQYLYYQNIDPMSQVNRYVAKMHYLPMSALIKSSYVTDISRFDAKHIHSMLDLLNIGNMQLYISGPNEETDLVEPWYQTGYSHRKITLSEAKRWLGSQDKRISLPKPNQFIPNQLSVFSGDSKLKEVTKGNWVMHDDTFNLPSVYLNTLIRTKPIKEPKDQMMLSIAALVLNESVTEQLYPALEAGMSWGVAPTIDGLVVTVMGKGDRHIQVRGQLFSALDTLSSEDHIPAFERIKYGLQQSLSAEENALPGQLLARYMAKILTPDSIITYQEKLALLDEITFADLQDFLKAYFSEVSPETYVYGNSQEDQDYSLDFDFKHINKTDAYLDFTPKYANRVTHDQTYNVVNKHTDHALVSYVQMKTDSYPEKVKAIIFAKMMAPAFFEQLRTNEQIGYMVRAQYMPVLKWPGIVMLLQSPHMKPEMIQERLKVFLSSPDFLIDSAFSSVKEALIHDLSAPFKTMDETHAYYFLKVLNHEDDLNAKEQLLAAAKQVTFSEVVAFYEEYFKADYPSLNLISDHDVEMNVLPKT